MKQVNVLIKILLLCMFISLFCTGPGKVNAQSPTPTSDSECQDQSQVVYESLTQINMGQYNVYVRLNRTGQDAEVRIFSQDQERSVCTGIGTVEANDQSWTKVGSLNIGASEQLLRLNLQLNDQNASQDASSPSVLIMSTVASPCSDPNNCTVEFQGQRLLLQPKKISFTADTLRVAQYLSYSNKTHVKEVIYSVDNKPAYTKPTLERFNYKYVAPGTHTITTTIVLADGQALKSQQQFDQSFGVMTFLWPHIYGQSGLVSIASTIIILIVVISLFVTILRYIRKKILWRKSHILAANRIRLSISEVSKQNRLKLFSWIDNANMFAKIIGVGLVVIMLLFGISQYVVGVFSVDGPSMETTLHDKTKHPLLNLPVTLGKINRHAYIPKRGEIVVFKKDENNLFDETAEKHDSFVVKRIIGLPGERVIVKEGKITIINKDKPIGFDPDKNVAWSSVIAPSQGRFIDITLKDGELFVSGDNRNESIDSRYYGPILASQIIGKVL